MRTISTILVASRTWANKPRIPDHELLRLIGRGSYGEIWLARSVVGTFRAIKVVYRNAFDQDRPYEREFAGIQKFEPISRSHEGLVDVLQIGRNDHEGYFYYVMELADALENQESEIKSQNRVVPASNDVRPLNPGSYQPRTLRHDLNHRGRLSLPECIEIGLAMTSALAHLHKYGLVHRDVKPLNTIFVDSVPKLADIGLVADINEARSFVGTDGFIPPEGPGSPSADLYSLGKVLYEISTGLDRQEFPRLPPDLKDNPDRAGLAELNEIIVKACAREPKQRYESAEQLRCDLELLQRGKSVKQQRLRQERLNFGKKLIFAGALLGATVSAFLLAENKLARHVHTISSAGEIFETSGTTNRAAWEAYRRGRFLINQQEQDSLPKAAAQFDVAIQLDPNFVEAYAGLATAYCFWFKFRLPPEEVFGKVEEAAHRALALKPNLPEAIAALGLVKVWYRFRPAEAEFLLHKAIRLDPKNERALEWLSMCLSWEGKPEEAIATAQRALELNPTDAWLNGNLGHRLLDARRLTEAIAQYRSALSLVPNDESVWWFLSIAYQLNNQWSEARDACLHIARSHDLTETVNAVTNAVSAHEGVLIYRRMELSEIEHSSTILHNATAPAMHAMLAEDYERAIQWLEKVEDEPAESGKLNVYPIYDPLRKDPKYAKRFADILKRLGFPPLR
jgi:serine/threonine protein kinase